MKKPNAHRKHIYPRTGQLAALADSYRPNNRPVYEYAPVNLGPAPAERNWFTLQDSRDIVDRYSATGRHEAKDARYLVKKGLISGSDRAGKKKTKDGWVLK